MMAVVTNTEVRASKSSTRKDHVEVDTPLLFLPLLMRNSRKGSVKMDGKLLVSWMLSGD